MAERRFSEEEVAEIFERAAEAQHLSRTPLASRQGMTLAQLQEIGREVGFAPEELANAAKAVEMAPRPTSRRFMGFPIGVGLTVDLDRKLSDPEWDRLVVDLRETFDARGKLTQEGNFRQWRNGNLQALVEPTETGHRLRLRTTKGDARGLMIGGLGMFAFGLISLLSTAASGAAADVGRLVSLETLAAAGLVMFGVGAFRLPGWARLRREQMEGVAARVAAPQNSQTMPDLNHDD